MIIKNEKLENELSEAIKRNAELTSIVKFYQVNLNRISKPEKQIHDHIYLDVHLDGELSKVSTGIAN